MDKLYDCVTAFEKLLDIQYHIIVGRKGKAVELCINFSKFDFHHLMGLGKLKDLRIATQNRGIVFDEILSGKITYKTISKSRYLHLIENRFQPLAQIESLFDDIYIFLAKRGDMEQYFCRSFFPKEQKDYTKGQAIYTMLYKEKICLSTGKIQVQYDRLTPKDTNKSEN